MGFAFPAHAGMNRLLIGGCTVETCVPRACGDEPKQEKALEEPEIAFPAHAGMNRMRNPACPMPSSVPRACGDEPLLEFTRTATDKRSPRMRG